MIGADGAIGGFTAFADWRRTGRTPPKDRDFALGVGPVVVTPDELDPAGLEVVVRVDAEERLRVALGALRLVRCRARSPPKGRRCSRETCSPARRRRRSRSSGPGKRVELAIDGIGALSARIEGSDQLSQPSVR